MSLFQLSNVTFKDIITYPLIKINENKTTFISGKSGSGKSTLLKLLNTSISPDHGEILYQDKLITEYDTIQLRREIMLVSQSVYLFDDTIRNNFKDFLDLILFLLLVTEVIIQLFIFSSILFVKFSLFTKLLINLILSSDDSTDLLSKITKMSFSYKDVLSPI